jgi:outer membrane protein OmpA-like peptidoglycan-associated protein
MSTNHQEDSTGNSSSAFGYLLPLLLFAFLAAGAYYLLGTGPDHATEESTHVAADSMPHEGAMAVTSETAGKVDSSGNYIYDLGNMVTIDLPNGAGALTVGEYSTENKLYQFLSDAKATIDTVKGNWFEFTNVRFLTGGSKVDSISSVQLKNIVALSKGFPAASFKVGGYTDNTGDSAANVTLSQKRSEAVVAELKKLGALSTAITGAKGYGPAFPIGDNATAEGRAMNRRVAINVKSK